MSKHIQYIELKTGFSDDGPAWIAEVEYSKSGRTIYFDNRALKRLKTPGVGCNHFDIETGEDYWISGVKKNGHDRHVCGIGTVMIDRDIIDEYVSIVDFDIPDKKNYEIVDVNKTFDKSRFNLIENNLRTFSPEDFPSYSTWYWDRNKKKLVLQ